ncbi:hypothetical protein [Subtercola boreus]|uniref:hypothetical protein n=1 Tax=Subtercola boreus TaxID=120213 RepID=UPI00209BDFEA|nr:hypothetical protein [Subtercola boreus]
MTLAIACCALRPNSGGRPTSVARSLAGAGTETIGLVLARDPQVISTESYYLQFLVGVETVLSEKGYGLLLQVVATNADDIVTMEKWRASRRVDGLLLMDVLVEDARVKLSSHRGTLAAVVVADPASRVRSPRSGRTTPRR